MDDRKVEARVSDSLADYNQRACLLQGTAKGALQRRQPRPFKIRFLHLFTFRFGFLLGWSRLGGNLPLART